MHLTGEVQRDIPRRCVLTKDLRGGPGGTGGFRAGGVECGIDKAEGQVACHAQLTAWKAGVVGLQDFAQVVACVVAALVDIGGHADEGRIGGEGGCDHRPQVARCTARGLADQHEIIDGLDLAQKPGRMAIGSSVRRDDAALIAGHAATAAAA